MAEAPAGREIGARLVVPGPVEGRDSVRGVELGRAVDVAVRHLFVLEVDPEDAELPELVGDVLPGVRDRSVRAHEDLVGVLHPFELRRAFERHDPAARVLALRLEPRGAGFLEELESLHPEAAREDVAFAGQEVVVHAHALHREEVAAHDGVGEATRERGRGGRFSVEVVARGGALDGVERGTPLLFEGGIGRVALHRERVKVPCEVAQPARRDAGRVAGEGVQNLPDLLAEALRASALDEVRGVLERDDDVGHLHARVVEIILDLDPPAEPLERVRRGRRRERRSAGARCARPCSD